MLSFTDLDQIEIDSFHDECVGEKLDRAVELAKSELYQKFYFFRQPKQMPPMKKAVPYFRFRQYQYVEKPIEEVFEFFSDAQNLERITPSQLSFKIDSQSTDQIQQGTEFIYKLKIHGVPAKWKTIITNWKPPFQFVDYQEYGPYKVWFHTHLFIPTKNGTLLVDEVKFVLPFRWIANFLVAWFIKLDVSKIFKHRFGYIGNYYK